MANISLYNITAQFPQLLEDVEITEEQRDIIFAELTELLQTKAEGVIGYSRNIELTIQAIKEEEMRLHDARKTLELRLNNFKEYVKECMSQANIDKVTTGLGTISLRKAPISCEVYDIDQVPEEFKTIKVEVVADKKKLNDHFKATGEIVKGCEFITEKKSIQIK